ncbi:MAG: hypothetical protein HXY45_23135 [Syntrophaceae bacterium]|nr:hypothetical protein [Syntrophaceae bacterium]
MRKKSAILILMAGLWAMLASGCTWAFSRDTIVRCPKCSTTFAVEDSDIHLRQLRE